MAYPGRQNIYDASIRRMVQESLARQEEEFRQVHGEDPEEQLLTYLRSWAFRLGRTPWPGEILGGRFIEERFGSWTRALALARLPAPRTPNRSEDFARYRAEVEVQKEAYRRRKAEKKAQASQRRQQQAARKKKSESFR